METPEQRVRVIAQTQRGAVTRRQALASGFTDQRIKRRITCGEWLRIDRGVYLVFGDLLPESLLLAAMAKLPAVVSHASAARMHGLLVPNARQPEVTVPHRFSNKFSGVAIHESTDLTRQHIMEVDGLPVTTPSRTIFDVAHRLGIRRLRRTVDAALVQRMTSIEELRDLLASIGRRGRPGTANMRLLLAELDSAYVAPESELERRLLEVLEAAGLPSPKLQMRLPWRSSVNGRVDAAYPGHRLIIECDGRRWHTKAAAFERDRQRDNLAQLAGWMVLRFTWDDVTKRPSDVVRHVRSGLERIPA